MRTVWQVFVGTIFANMKTLQVKQNGRGDGGFAVTFAGVGSRCALCSVLWPPPLWYPPPLCLILFKQITMMSKSSTPAPHDRPEPRGTLTVTVCYDRVL